MLMMVIKVFLWCNDFLFAVSYDFSKSVDLFFVDVSCSVVIIVVTIVVVFQQKYYFVWATSGKQDCNQLCFQCIRHRH